MAEATQRERTASRVSFAMATVALAVAVLNLSGWAIGSTPLVRVRLDWPVVAPWAALWVMALSLSVLAQGGPGIRKHSAALVSLGRGLAVLVGLSSAVVLVEYALDATWIDLWWFPEAVRAAQQVRPGRPPLPTTVTMGALAVLCLLIRVEAKWVRRVWIGSQVVLLPWPLLALSGYVFRALDVLSTSLSHGMAFTTTLAAVFIAAAGMASRVDRPILAWFMDRPDRVTLARLTLVLAGLPAGVWLVRVAASTYLSGERDPWVVALVFGTVAAGVGVYAVSARQQRDLFAQLALRDQVVEANDQLRQVMDHSPIGLCTVGPDGRLLTANPAFCRLLGRDEETLRRLTWREVSHPDDAGRAEALLDDLLSGRVGSFDLRHRYLRPDGELVWTDVSATALHADDGSVRMVISQVVDVTAQVGAQAALEESEQRYRLLAENTADVVALSKEGVFQWVSPSVTSGFGWAPEELVGRPVAGYIHPDDRGWVLSRRDGVERGEAARLRYRFLAKDQRYRWVEVAAAPFLGPDGRPEGVVTNVRVVDAAVEAEEQLQHARAAAEVAAEAKATFLANMSHEIRTPLSAVLGLLRLLRDSDQTEVQHDYTVRAEQSAQSLLDILNDILDFSKIEAGALALHQQPFSLDAMVRNLGTVLAANLGDKPVDLLFDTDPKCPDRVVGDELRLRQVLLNLCGNALKFTPAGHVLVSTRVASRTSDRVTLRVSVEDTGIGMAAEAVAQVTDSFAQADPGIARSYGGTGLGLAITTRLLGLMGSELEVTSSPGAGSTFAFTVSLGLVESAPSEPEPAELPALRARLVGGSPALQEVTGGICRSFGWQVDAGSGGAPSDESAAPEVILVDLPSATAEDMDVISRLRAANPRPMTPEAGSAPGTVIVALATQTGLAGVSPADASRLDGYVVKPFTPSSLLDAVVAARARQPAALPERAARVPRLTGIRVLLVEDNEINRQVAEAMLRNEQAYVSVATDGRAAVDRVLADPGAFDIVLMDQQMPVMDGLAAARAIRAEPAADRLPVLAMTANATEADRQACLEAGMSDHLGKPFDLDDLVDRVLRLTTHAAGGPQATAASANGGAVVLDTVSGLRRVGDRKDFYARMLATFAGGLSARVAGIEHAVADGDRGAAGRLAHALSGAAATLGAMRLASAAAEVESSAAQDGPAGSSVDTSALGRCAEETQAAMSAWVSSHGLKADEAAPVPHGGPVT